MTNAYLNHPWTRYVALGDSFTEGIGDPEPECVGGNRGWADRVAEVLSDDQPDFGYANLAVRGKILSQISDEQVEPVLQLRPDLITISAGGNDVIRPGPAPRSSSSPGRSRVLTIFSGHAGKSRDLQRELALCGSAARLRGSYLWSLTAIHDAGMWAPDWLRFSPLGHHTTRLPAAF
ncbi:SGNH/GDSL hydrolase family protein [Cryobacterium sp. Y82]|uniref:SGNH/GDSL hydrolase family protein n=1 Tax=Cryobacterium sp. Y82 TaxID=2045017 RepID=UPI003518FF8A